jgi:hypothetical protein
VKRDFCFGNADAEIPPGGAQVSPGGAGDPAWGGAR